MPKKKKEPVQIETCHVCRGEGVRIRYGGCVGEIQEEYNCCECGGTGKLQLKYYVKPAQPAQRVYYWGRVE